MVSTGKLMLLSSGTHTQRFFRTFQVGHGAELLFRAWNRLGESGGALETSTSQEKAVKCYPFVKEV